MQIPRRAVLARQLCGLNDTRIIGRMRWILIVALSLFFLFSCIGIETEITIDDDGSGEITLSYKVSRLVIHLGTLEEDRPFFAVPVSRQDFDDITESVPGLRLRSFDMDEDASDVFVDATLAFDDIDALNALFGSNGRSSITLSRSGGRTVYKHVIYEGNGEEVNDDSRKMVEALFSDYALRFSLTAPDDISTVSHGIVSGRNATIEHTIAEVIDLREPLVWEISW